MNSTPSSSWHNCFNVLHVEQINDIETKIQDMQKPNPCCNKSWMEALSFVTLLLNTLLMETLPSVTFLSNTSSMEALPSMTFSSNTLLMEALPSMTFSSNMSLMETFPSATPSVRTCCPKWERSLPQKFVIAATEENPMSLRLKVEIKTTDTAEKKSVSAFVDCGATGEFIERHYAKSSCFNLVKLTQPIPVYNVDGTLNKAGSITEVVSLILHYKNHSERTTFAVCGLGKQKLILGHSWLQKHNPEIDWVTQEVKMSKCPPRSCPGCRDEACQEHAAQKAEVGGMTIVLPAPSLRLVTTLTLLMRMFLTHPQNLHA